VYPPVQVYRLSLLDRLIASGWRLRPGDVLDVTTGAHARNECGAELVIEGVERIERVICPECGREVSGDPYEKDERAPCDDCGSHPALRCECGELVDTVYAARPPAY